MVEEKRSPKFAVDPDKILLVIQTALEGKANKVGIFAQPIEPPEVSLVEIAKRYEIRNNIENFALHTFFFLLPTLIADNSTRQLARVTRPTLFYPHAWLFRPEIVTKKSDTQVREAAQDLTGAGHNQRALEKWRHNASVLYEHYESNLKNFFEENLNHAPSILEKLKGPKVKVGWEGFHRFGEKTGRLFLMWAKHYGLAELEDIEDIGIPVDFQVTRLMVQTGGLLLDEPIHKHWVQDRTLTPFFRTFCKNHGLSSLEVSETLWLIGNRCCNNYRHDLCPLHNLCTKLISREPLNTRGFINPTDVGRWKTRREVWAQKKGEKS